MGLLNLADVPPALMGALVGILGYAILLGAWLRHGARTTALFRGGHLEPSHARAG